MIQNPKAASLLGGGAVFIASSLAVALPVLATSVQESKVSVHVQIACSLEAENNTHSETITPNTYDEQVGNNDTTFTTYCNDSSGYVIYAVGLGADDKEGVTDMLGSNGHKIATGTATSGPTSNWAFKLSGASEGLTITSGFDSFHAIPNTRTAVLKRESGTSSVTKDNFKATYAAYISGTETPDTYTGKVRYLLFHPSEHNATNQEITDLTYMQDFAKLDPTEKAALVATMEANTQYELTDSRDGRKYYIAKLDDGNVWMTENLDLDLSADRTYTSTDTDVTEDWRPSASTHVTSDTTWNSSNVEGQPGVINPQSYDPGDKCWKGERTWSSGDHSSTDLEECSEHDSSHFHIGNYYNYAAAVAQNDTSSHTANGQTYSTSICPAGWQLPANEGDKSFINLQQKAGAAGHTWAAGYIGSKTEGQTTTTLSTMQNEPFYFPYSGYWRGAFYYFGSIAYYRSSAVSSSTGSYYLNFNGSGSLNPQNSGGWRLDGFSVRCVLR